MDSHHAKHALLHYYKPAFRLYVQYLAGFVIV